MVLGLGSDSYRPKPSLVPCCGLLRSNVRPGVQTDNRHGSMIDAPIFVLHGFAILIGFFLYFVIRLTALFMGKT